MKNRLSIAALVLVIVALAALTWHFYGGQRVPAGQPSLVSLTPENFDQLRRSFNMATGEVRVVLLLSPT
jgi:outer membrane lipopolysaccharide assembly protein LptE/RlpB